MTVRTVDIEGVSFLLSVVGGDTKSVAAALDAGVDSLREGMLECAADMELVESGWLDVLPRSRGARKAMEIMRVASSLTSIDVKPAFARRVLFGALLDQALEMMLALGPIDSAFVVNGECGAFSVTHEGVLDVPAVVRASLWLELVHGLRPGLVKGGIASEGKRMSAKGDADIVSLYSRTAAEAILSALLVADAVQMDDAARRLSVPPPEAVWDALSLGVRRLSVLRDAQMTRSGVLTLRGRGRLIGPIMANRLLRFGVSDWR